MNWLKKNLIGLLGILLILMAHCIATEVPKEKSIEEISYDYKATWDWDWILKNWYKGHPKFKTQPIKPDDVIKLKSCSSSDTDSDTGEDTMATYTSPIGCVPAHPGPPDAHIPPHYTFPCAPDADHSDDPDDIILSLLPKKKGI